MPLLTPNAWRVIRAHSAWRLDLAPADLPPAAGPAEALVKAHGPKFASYHGVYLWLMDGGAVVSAPPEWVGAVRAAVAGRPVATLGEPALWRAALSEHVERIVGPSYQGYADTATFRPAPTAPEAGVVIRRLTPADLPALERLAAACPPQEWEDSAIHPSQLGDVSQAPIYAAERAGALVAAASAPGDAFAASAAGGAGAADARELGAQVVASVGVITHPAWRGRGYGRAVVAALTTDRLASGALLRYQTLEANRASVALARALGYHQAATALAVRLRRG